MKRYLWGMVIYLAIGSFMSGCVQGWAKVHCIDRATVLEDDVDFMLSATFWPMALVGSIGNIIGAQGKSDKRCHA